MNSPDWIRAFGALAIAAACVTGYNAATGSYGGSGITLPFFEQQVPVGGQQLSSGGSNQVSAPAVNWRLQNAASIAKGRAAASTGQGSFSFDSKLNIPRFALTPDDRYLMGTDNSSAHVPPAVWQTSDGAALATLAGNDGRGDLVPSYTEDGRAVMVGIVDEKGTSGGSTARPQSLIVTDIITGEVIRTQPGPDTLAMPPACIQTVSSNAKVAVCVHFAGKTVSWNPLRGGITAAWNVVQQRADEPPAFVTKAALSADGSALAVLLEVDPAKLAIGEPLPPITIWNTESGTEIGRLQVSQPVEALALMASGRELLTVLQDGSVWLTTIATSASEKLAQLDLDPTVAPDSRSAIFSANTSVNDESVVATYSVYRDDDDIIRSRPEPSQIIRVDMRSRKQIRYRSPFVGGLNLVGVVVPSREQWLIGVYGGAIYKIFPPVSDLLPDFGTS